jgi:nitroreductase
VILTGNALASYRNAVLGWLKPTGADPGPYDEDGAFDEKEIGSSVLPRHLLERKKRHVKRLIDHMDGIGLKLKDVYNLTYLGHNAPVVIMVIGDVVNREHRRGLEVHQALAAAMQNMLLAAHAMGYGACWIGDMMKFGERLNKFLELQPGKELVGGITLGRPMGNLDIKAVPKLPVNEMISWRTL